MWNAGSRDGSPRRGRLRLLALCLPAFLAGGNGCAPPEPSPTVLRIETDPAGAEARLDGERIGDTPITFPTAAPGLRILELRLDGHQPVILPVELPPGATTRRHVSMQPVEGLVLVESNPAGADVTVAGVYRGKTPVAVTDFPAGVQRVRLEMAGHDSREIEVTVRDRTPQRHQVELLSHLGGLKLVSVPEGASVRLDGKLVGKTPLDLTPVEEGHRQIEFRLSGYLTQTREVQVQAGEVQEVQVTLDESPGTLRVESFPPGARVRVEGLDDAVAPHEYADLAPGTYAVLFSADGYADTSVEAVVQADRRITVRGELKLVSGAVQVVSIPPGAQVFVDEALAGTTVRSASELISEPLLTEKVPEGAHKVTLVKEGYLPLDRWVRVEAGKTVVLQERLTKRWMAETEVVLEGEIRYQGVIREKYPDGGLLMEVAPGVMKRIEAEKIRAVRQITEPVGR